MVVTPDGTIIRMIDGPPLKEETDPDWELRKAERKAKIEAKRARLRDAPTQDYGDESSDEDSDDISPPSPKRFAMGSPPSAGSVFDLSA